MADTKLEVKKATAPRRSPAVPDVWQSFRTEMDRLFDRFGAGFGFPSLRRMFDAGPPYEGAFGFATPMVDFSEDDTAYKLTAELPGADEKDIEVGVTDEILTIKGEKKQEKEEKTKNYYMSERSYGSFQRAFALPKGVEHDKIAAQFSKGVLTITMPKTAAAQSQRKKIEVKPG